MGLLGSRDLFGPGIYGILQGFLCYSKIIAGMFHFKICLFVSILNIGLSMIGIPGIARRKSNVGQNMGVELRGSYNSQHSTRGTLDTTFESSQDEFVLTDKRITSQSRPTSGHGVPGTHSSIGSNAGFNAPSYGLLAMLATSTPSHSRSPSMTSNRDSLISNEEGKLYSF